VGTLETYHALPAPERAYTEYDYGIVAEIIQFAELRAQEEARKGKGDVLCGADLHVLVCACML